jgi:hypothetical protein
MRADPKPEHGVALLQPQRSPSDSHAHRVDRRSLPDALEIKPGMLRVDFPDAVVLACLATDAFGQPAKAGQELVGQFRLHSSSKPRLVVLPRRRAERAFAASRSSRPWDFASVWSHFNSPRMSSSICSANCACAASGKRGPWQRLFPVMPSSSSRMCEPDPRRMVSVHVGAINFCGTAESESYAISSLMTFAGSTPVRRWSRPWYR